MENFLELEKEENSNIKKLNTIVSEMLAIKIKSDSFTSENFSEKDKDRFHELIISVIEDQSDSSIRSYLLRMCIATFFVFEETKICDLYNQLSNRNIISEQAISLLEEASGRNEYLLKKLNESKIFYRHYKDEFEQIKLNIKSRKCSKDEIEFLESMVDPKLLKSIYYNHGAFIVLVYKKINDENFLKLFPDLIKVDIENLRNKNRFSDQYEYFISITKDYCDNFCDALKPRKTRSERNNAAKKKSKNISKR